ncbi:DUF2987 domain-containing protein [Enterovibrio nigricans]|uniref:DUF2987 domain-containing protein n=1 Tax=Enterovibrio nigricans DSM 22720 TaxID=1121868 RepID=A0A1T4V1P4_9GAMM|nr:DUF2987 domain-containing protein [Enterovibrio nigricans]PKF50445.1 DUF2987 domain-containing protein [Enterovibrio nigricans]SKA58865.1 Protein of unknown function [Enterovibrio nigricans DSM 22720]
MIKGLTAALIAAVISVPATAAQVELRYSKLYSQLKHNYGENHPDVKVGYFLISPETGKVCEITKAWMIKKQHSEFFVIPPSQELPLPIDNHLRQVNPDVFIETMGDAVCDVSFQVLAKESFNEEMSAEEIQNLVPQMTAMMKDLGGMFASWFMPEVEGVMVHFAEPVSSLSTSEGRSINVDGKVAIIRVDELKQGEKIAFTKTPLKVTPWIPQS